MKKIYFVMAAFIMIAGAFIVINEAEDQDAANTYTLNYDANGGSGAPSTQTYTTNETGHVFTVSSTQPTRTNYDFLGWSTSSSASSPSYQAGDSITCTIQLPTVTLYAVWQYNAPTTYTYSLSYNANGGSGAPSTQSQTTTATSYQFTVSSTQPTRTNYDFLGWSTSNSASSPSYQGGDSITCSSQLQSITLYAVWQYNPPQYTCYLYYNANGGSGAPSTQSYTGTSTSSHIFTVSSSLPYRSDYDFLGWSESSSSSTPSYYGGSSISVPYNGSRTLYAVWEYNAPTTYTYSLSYNANGGSGAPTTQSYSTTSTGHTFTVSSTQPTRSDYNFLGWATSSGASTPSYYGGSSITCTSQIPSITLYAVWSATTYTYTLNYDANGGTGAPASQSQTTTATGYQFTVSATQPTRDNYAFLGWATSNDATVPTLQGGDTVTCTSQLPTVTIYAVWSPTYTYTLNYDANGGTGAPASETHTTTATGYSFTVSSTAPTRSDYNFLGWATSNDATVPTLQAGDTVTCTVQLPTVTLYAVWSAATITYTYTLNYDANGGSGAPASETQTSTQTGYQFTVSATQPTRSDYNFLGWATSNDATVPTLQAGDTVTCTSQLPTVTIYAVWSAITYTYTLNYDANGGSGAPASETHTTSATGYQFTVSATQPTRSDYNFLGWATSSGASTPTLQAGDTVTCTSQLPTVTIYAVWQYNAPTPPPLSGDVFWSNDLYNGSVSIAFKFSATTSRIHSMNIPLYNGTVNNNVVAWAYSDYILDVSVSYPSTVVTATLNYNGSPVSGMTVTQDMGRWSGFVLTIDSDKSQLSFTPMNRFNDFTSYTQYDNLQQTVLDWSSVTQAHSMFEIAHTDTGSGDHVSFAVVNTDTFLNTYGVVMTDPSINVYDYFPDYSSVRLNFYSFALYGSSMTVNGVTFPVTDGNVTVYYTVDSDRNNIIATPSDEGAQSRTLTLSNIYVTWEGGKCSLTFVNDRFTVQLGTYSAGSETISFTGFWYFNSAVYQPVTYSETVISGDWKMMPDIPGTVIVLVFLGICILMGLIAHVKFGLKWLDGAVILVTAIIGYILLG